MQIPKPSTPQRAQKFTVFHAFSRGTYRAHRTQHEEGETHNWAYDSFRSSRLKNAIPRPTSQATRCLRLLLGQSRSFLCVFRLLLLLPVTKRRLCAQPAPVIKGAGESHEGCDRFSHKSWLHSPSASALKLLGLNLHGTTPLKVLWSCCLTRQTAVSCRTQWQQTASENIRECGGSEKAS